MVVAAEAAGIPVLARGAVDANAPAGGYYFAPALFGAVDPDCDDCAARKSSVRC